MKRFFNQKTKIFIFFFLLCLALFANNLFALDEPQEQPQFKIIYPGSTNGSFMIIPTNIANPQVLTGLKPLTKVEFERIANLPEVQFVNTSAPMAMTIPTNVNNALTQYFRPIFMQSGGSCGQAAGIGYAFTYEIDFERNLNANIEANQYPTHYTWNFLNGGFGGGSWHFDGWDIIKDNGCPDVPTWGEMDGDDTRWMSGYANYYSGMQNRTLFYEQIANVNTPAGLANLKHWLFDHGNGSAVGGVACFAVFIFGADYVVLPAGTPHAGKIMLTRWGNDGYHAMTIVGFDDTVCFDFNNDGQFTNNIDINSDGVVDMRDWETGALIFANSWGTGYADNGFCYLAYKSIADPDKRGFEALTWNAVHVVKTKPVNVPKTVLKTSINYPIRNRLHIYASVTQSGEIWTKYFGRQFDNNGGSHPLRGRADFAPLELGLDVTSLFEQIDPQKCAQFNLHVTESDFDNSLNGEIISYSLLDYTSGNAVETAYPQTNIPIDDNTLITISINRCPSTPLRVQYHSFNRNPESNTLYVNFRVYNDSTAPMLISNLKTKYWYTCEGTGVSETANVDWAGILPSGKTITPKIVKQISAINLGGQNRVCTISFNTGTDSIQPGGYVECKYRIYKSNWSNYTQTNDYSFGTQTSNLDWPRITVYANNALVWGNEP